MIERTSVKKVSQKTLAVTVGEVVSSMKVACIDKTAADRLKLQRLLEDAFDNCRASIGHLPTPNLFPLSKDEAFFSAAASGLPVASSSTVQSNSVLPKLVSPGSETASSATAVSVSSNALADIVVVGSAWPLEDAIRCCRELRQTFPQQEIIVFLEPEAFTLRNLRRFESFTQHIFATSEQPIRIIHTLSLIEKQLTRKAPGLLVVATGVKGGVGTTSIVGALAHTAEALGSSAIIVDLSLNASLAHYFAAPRWQSSEFSAALVDGVVPDRESIRKFIAVAPNGIHLLLAPAGGTDIRDLWLRESKRFELTLEVIEILRELYQVVIVDTAGAEGLVPFALQARADVRFAITSNEPASVHLLNLKLSEFQDIPGAGTTHIIVNRLFDRGLTTEDVGDFIQTYINKDASDVPVHTVSYDAAGRAWIGTGNSLYTEASKGLQKQFENILAPLIDRNYQIQLTDNSRDPLNIIRPLKETWQFVISNFEQRKFFRAPQTKALPAPVLNPTSMTSSKESDGRRSSKQNTLDLLAHTPASDCQARESNILGVSHSGVSSGIEECSSAENASSTLRAETDPLLRLYEPPKLAAGSR